MNKKGLLNKYSVKYINYTTEIAIPGAVQGRQFSCNVVQVCGG